MADILNTGHSLSSIAYKSIKEGIAIKINIIAGKIVQTNSNKVAFLNLLFILASV